MSKALGHITSDTQKEKNAQEYRKHFLRSSMLDYEFSKVHLLDDLCVRVCLSIYANCLCSGFTSHSR